MIGYGYWGPNIVRNFHGQEHSRVIAVCDKSPNSLRRVRQAHSDIRLTSDYEELLTSQGRRRDCNRFPRMDALRVGQGRAAEWQARFCGEAVHPDYCASRGTDRISRRKNLKIMVDHTFLFTGAVRKMQELIDDGSLGDLYYYDSTRMNLGLLQHDVNVLWDLAPHDLSIMDHLIEGKPEAVVATGESHLNGTKDVAFMTLYFPNRVIAHINVNWLSPVKVRMTLIGGEKKMLVWNDLVADEKIQRVRPRREDNERRRNHETTGELSFRRHVGPAARAVRGA